ncbi:MAG: putative toxin-antitoxin system toxin component, PIN family [Solirubrobacterales bacterium]
MTRAVVDPGVLISAFISPRGSAPDRIVRAWRNGAFELLVSPLLISELATVLTRPKFAAQASEDRAAAYIAALAAGSVLIEDPSERPVVTEDPGDDYLFALARAGRAHVVVSGDRHLTELQDSDPPVLTPRQFADRLEAENEADVS